MTDRKEDFTCVTVSNISKLCWSKKVLSVIGAHARNSEMSPPLIFHVAFPRTRALIKLVGFPRDALLIPQLRFFRRRRRRSKYFSAGNRHFCSNLKVLPRHLLQERQLLINIPEQSTRRLFASQINLHVLGRTHVCCQRCANSGRN